MEIFIGVVVTLIMLTCVFVASFVSMPTWGRITLIIVGIIPLVIGIYYSLKIEQFAGYYECANCHYKYVPTYKSVLMTLHTGRTRRMICVLNAVRKLDKKRN